LKEDGNTNGFIIKNFDGNEVQLVNADNGAMVFKTNDTEAMRIDGSQNTMFGKTAPNGTDDGVFIHNEGYLFCVKANEPTAYFNRKSSNGDNVIFRKDNVKVGSVSVTASSTSYNTSSDHRLKENDVDMTGAISRVKQLQPKRFNFISDTTDTLVDGFMAHEVQSVVPEAVTGTHNEVDDDGNAVMQGIDQSKLVPLLTGALQEAITKIETLETEMTALKARVTTLETA